MKIFIYLPFLLLLCTNTKGDTNVLSKEAEINLITCSPGAELYSLFGHTAIHIHDPKNNINDVYNYGTFDFNTPNFYLKYAKGLLPYQLSKIGFPNFLYAYKEEKRSVFSQTLQLDSITKQKIYDLILINYRPENRSYLYNFLFDNCTTRSRDILLQGLTTDINWNSIDSSKNFWNLLDEYLHVSPWVQWGIHTILGQGGNRQATTFEYMFLPDYLMYGLEKATYNGQLLAEKTQTLYEAPEMKNENRWYTHPIFIFAAGAVLLVLMLQSSHSAVYLSATATLLLIVTGLLGCLIVFLGAFTAHPITAPNWNILWANPLNLLIVPFIWKKALPVWINSYLKIYMTLLTIAIPVWIIEQPAVPGASLSIILFMIYLTLRLRAAKKI